ncbi:GAF domain-containing protein [Oscillatoria sp. FACHB-1406]|uniref:GAF domain-containing sensor histidine kinase n=1 Tax=Oscillatoria sp. FACHB-1406 TaxID=2692846 RepID=UPI0016895759|nr:GAF domain-containing protein [Oscillatoria sp. FACHB-1406]MBD2577478.1 GAF domain-containing sensor histidine kinase [Oscillatoria sp. FACHB-1406]
MSILPKPDRQFNALQQAAYQLSSCTDQIFRQIEQEQILASIVDRIRSSLDLQTILTTTSTTLRQFLNADRVGVFRFTPGSGWDEGEFVAEDVVAEFNSAMAAKVYDRCFGSQFATYYARGRVQAVADIYNAGLSDCHVQILEQFQVRANLIVPVLKGEELWGLLCIHQCSNPRRWEFSEIEFVQKIAAHFAIALQQSEYLEQIKHQAALLVQTTARERALLRQKALVKIVNKVRQSLAFEEICQTATKEVRQLLEADRVTIYRFNPDWSGAFLFESVVDPWKPLVGASPSIEDTYLMETQGGRYAANETFAVSDIYAVGHSDCHIALLEEFQAKAYAIAPIFEGDRLWGLLTAFQNSAPRQWQTDEIELLAQIGEQLGIALQQAESVRQIQAQSIELKQILEELQQSQMQLVQNEKMASLGQLVAGVAHEINNPVNFIHGNLTHLNEYVNDLLTLARCYKQSDPEAALDIKALQAQAEDLDIDYILEDLPKTLASMQMGANRIRQIVLSLRNFSRLDEAAFKAVDIHEGIDSTLLILRHRMLKMNKGQYKVEIIKNYGDIPLVECYPAQLNQVFMNLISNALDALEEAIADGKLCADDQDNSSTPTIWISTRMDEKERVEISIRDNGIGVKGNNEAKIFDHFFTTKPVGKGTGLGLAISRQIISEKHCGTLILNSSLKQGAEFVIRLSVKLQNQSIS